MGKAVVDALHIPKDLSPVLTTLKDLTQAGAKFAAGEGDAAGVNKIIDQLKHLSSMVDTMEEGPLRKMVMGLKNEAMGKLQVRMERVLLARWIRGPCTICPEWKPFQRPDAHTHTYIQTASSSFPLPQGVKGAEKIVQILAIIGTP